MFNRKTLAIVFTALIAVGGLAGANAFYSKAPTASNTCCVPGADCCFPGSPCCEAGASCCVAGAPCCVPGSPCCESGNVTCCDVGADCCAAKSACCTDAAKTAAKATPRKSCCSK